MEMPGLQEGIHAFQITTEQLQIPEGKTLRVREGMSERTQTPHALILRHEIQRVRADDSLSSVS